ncbi:hypothetical protein LIER_43773 [Lithospermum erythrorhizon]|uniref:Uncharacterized protein n=1 Tax=Lithospermum erythrorhizon TaxID=34254 RepID=A0AAV3QV18_LITER
MLEEIKAMHQEVEVDPSRAAILVSLLAPITLIGATSPLQILTNRSVLYLNPPCIWLTLVLIALQLRNLTMSTSPMFSRDTINSLLLPYLHHPMLPGFPIPERLIT